MSVLAFILIAVYLMVGMSVFAVLTEIDCDDDWQNAVVASLWLPFVLLVCIFSMVDFIRRRLWK